MLQVQDIWPFYICSYYSTFSIYETYKNKYIHTKRSVGIHTASIKDVSENQQIKLTSQPRFSTM